MAADVFTNVLKAFTARLGALESRAATVLYGRVETVNPLSVRQSDGSLLLDVETLEPDLDVGDPVRMLAHNGFRVGSRVVVVGRVGVPVLGRRIPAAANLNTYTVPGDYYCPMNVDVATLTNGPPTDKAGSLEVREASGVIQYWHDYDTAEDGQIWRRRFYAGAWSSWQGIGGELQPGQLVGWSRRGDVEDNNVATLDHYMGVYGTLYSTRTYLVEVHTPTWWLNTANAVMTMQLRMGSSAGAKPTPSTGTQLGRVNVTMGQSTYGAMPGGNIAAMVQVSTTGTYYFGLFFAPITAGHTARMYDAIMTITDYGHGQPGHSAWVP